MITNWRSWVLLVLLIGPFGVYLGLGALWLLERGWLLPASLTWVTLGVVFSLLASRWTKTGQAMLPPLDWEAPDRFSPLDKQAWSIVREEVERGEAAPLEQLTQLETYVTTGQALAQRLARHYKPEAEDPIESVPVVDVLTALELAAEDLGELCRQLPGGDLITPNHWKQAIRAANWLQKANDVYSYVLPIFQPITGLSRLFSQQMMVKPAWRNMQQNILRWFHEAYVNRLGMHLIELYSGRLAMGASTYRKLSRRHVSRKSAAVATEGSPRTRIVFAGADGVGKTKLIDAIRRIRAGDLGRVKAQLAAQGMDPSLVLPLGEVELVEAPSYPVGEFLPSAKSRWSRPRGRDCLEAAVGGDLLVLVHRIGMPSQAADLEFSRAWDEWFFQHPGRERPPAMLVLTGVDEPFLEGLEPWAPPYNWAQGQRARERHVRERMLSFRGGLPPAFRDMVAVGLSEVGEFGVEEGLIPALATMATRAERAALLRMFDQYHHQSKVGRVLRQAGRQGRSLLGQLWSRGATTAGSEPASRATPEVHSSGKRDEVERGNGAAATLPPEIEPDSRSPAGRLLGDEPSSGPS